MATLLIMLGYIFGEPGHTAIVLAFFAVIAAVMALNSFFPHKLVKLDH